MVLTKKTVFSRIVPFGFPHKHRYEETGADEPPGFTRPIFAEVKPMQLAVPNPKEAQDGIDEEGSGFQVSICQGNPFWVPFFDPHL